MADTMERTLKALEIRITRVFPDQIRKAVQPLSDEQVWWRPNDSSNSIANLVLHLTGSLDHFLNRNLGGFDFTRDRAAEFSAREGAAKQQLMNGFDAMVDRAARTFASMSAETLSRPSPEPSMHSLVVEDLINICAHVSNHAGQIVWIAKMLAEGVADELWMHSHRDQGAWKRREA